MLEGIFAGIILVTISYMVYKFFGDVLFGWKKYPYISLSDTRFEEWVEDRARIQAIKEINELRKEIANILDKFEKEMDTFKAAYNLRVKEKKG